MRFLITAAILILFWAVGYQLTRMEQQAQTEHALLMQAIQDARAARCQ